MSSNAPDLDRLAGHRTIDLTTFGRRSGLPRRIEIWWFLVEGRFIISGTPGRRDWLANAKARPEVIVHVDEMDLPATVITVEDRAFRRRFFTNPGFRWYRTQTDLERLVAEAPMVEVVFDPPVMGSSE